VPERVRRPPRIHGPDQGRRQCGGQGGACRRPEGRRRPSQGRGQPGQQLRRHQQVHAGQHARYRRRSLALAAPVRPAVRHRGRIRRDVRRQRRQPTEAADATLGRCDALQPEYARGGP
jgi:hypothetical protein